MQQAKLAKSCGAFAPVSAPLTRRLCLRDDTERETAQCAIIPEGNWEASLPLCALVRTLLRSGLARTLRVRAFFEGSSAKHCQDSAPEGSASATWKQSFRVLAKQRTGANECAMGLCPALVPLAEGWKQSFRWAYALGFKLHLVVNEVDQLLNAQLTPGNVDDRRPLPDLLQSLFGNFLSLCSLPLHGLSVSVQIEAMSGKN